MRADRNGTKLSGFLGVDELFPRKCGAMFSADELRVHLARLEREQSEQAADLAELDEDEILRESPDRAAARVRQFAVIKELLTATTLGTS